MASEETLRLLLQKTLERNDGLVKINHQSTLAIPTILGVVWGILIGYEKRIDAIPLFAIITIGILLFWRYFAHYIDDDIASSYSRIMQLEKNLQVPQELSIYCGLIRKISKNGEFLTKANNLPRDAKIKLIDHLLREKRLGYRGHDRWDLVAFVLILLFSVISISTMLQSTLRTIHIFPQHYPLVLILIIKIVFFCFTLFIGLVITSIIVIIFRGIAPIQRGIDDGELKKLCPSLFDEKKTD